MTSDSGPCPSLTEHEYEPRYFDEPDCLSSDKENMPPIESVTPHSLRNLSLEEETNQIEHEATLWEANVARNLDPLPRSSYPYPKKTSTFNMTDFFERPPNEKRSPIPKQTDSNQEQCPTPQNSPTHIPKNSITAAVPAKPHRNEIQRDPPRQKKSTCGCPA